MICPFPVIFDEKYLGYHSKVPIFPIPLVLPHPYLIYHNFLVIVFVEFNLAPCI
jgi:hypothetical protein